MSTIILLASLSLLTSAAGDRPGNRLDMNAADDAQNAPWMVDSRFVVRAQTRCAAAMADAEQILRTSQRPAVRRMASSAAATCERLGAAFAAVERQKAWTLPPPGEPLYGRLADLSDSGYVAVQSANERALVGLFDAEAAEGRDGTLHGLVRRELPALRRDLESARRAATDMADGPE